MLLTLALKHNIQFPRVLYELSEVRQVVHVDFVLDHLDVSGDVHYSFTQQEITQNVEVRDALLVNSLFLGSIGIRAALLIPIIVSVVIVEPQSLWILVKCEALRVGERCQDRPGSTSSAEQKLVFICLVLKKLLDSASREIIGICLVRRILMIAIPK